MRIALALVLLVACERPTAGPVRWQPTALAASAGRVVALATDGTWVAWCEHEEYGPAERRRRLRAVAVAGGPLLTTFTACDAVTVRAGVAYWAGGRVLSSRALPDGEPVTVDASGDDAIVALAVDDTHLHVLRTRHLERRPLAGGAGERIWAVPEGSVGATLALGEHAAWVATADDVDRPGAGAVAVVRVDTSGAPLALAPAEGAVRGLHVDGGHARWLAGDTAWQAPDRADGVAAVVDRERADAIDGHGLYYSTRPPGPLRLRYVLRPAGPRFTVDGVAEHIRPIAGGFVALFPALARADTARVGERPALVPSPDHGVIGVVRWAP